MRTIIISLVIAILLPIVYLKITGRFYTKNPDKKIFEKLYYSTSSIAICSFAFVLYIIGFVII